MKKYDKIQYYINNISSEHKIKRLFQFIIGCLLISFAYNIFIVPNKLVPGGVGGIAIIINNLFGLNYTTVIFLLNSILLLTSLILLGKDKTKASLLGTILFPVLIKLTENINVWIEFDTSKILLSTIFGGIIYGIGAGLVFKAGYTTGGTDIINQIISKYFKTSLGQSMLMSDGLIVLSSGIFLGINSMLYSIVILYLISTMSDKIVLDSFDKKTAYIITSKAEEVRKFIKNELKYEIVSLKAQGGYYRKERDVLITVFQTSDYYYLREGLKNIDSKIIYIITDTYEVFGGK